MRHVFDMKTKGTIGHVTRAGRGGKTDKPNQRRQEVDYVFGRLTYLGIRCARAGLQLETLPIVGQLLKQFVPKTYPKIGKNGQLVQKCRPKWCERFFWLKNVHPCQGNLTLQSMVPLAIVMGCPVGQKVSKLGIFSPPLIPNSTGALFFKPIW